MDEIDSKAALLSLDSFDELCRGCLQKPDSLYHIFDLTFEDVGIQEILKSCTSIKIEQNDELPQQMCGACISRLCEFYTFRKICLDSEVLLQASLHNHSYKVFLSEELQIDTELIVKSDPDVKSETSNEPAIQFHVNNVESTCSRCNNLVLAEDYSTHMQKHKNDEQSQSNDNSLQESLTERPVTYGKRKCSICNKTVGHRSYSRHKRTHNNEKPYLCQLCPASFNVNTSLKRHLMTHTGERPHLCDICGKTFVQEITFIEHKRLHTGEKPYLCPNCGRSYAQHSNFKTHLDKQNCLFPIRRTANVKRDSNKYRCQICYCGFGSEDMLNEHVCEKKPFDCDQCERTFITPIALKMHSRIHSETKDYTCTTCYKSFIDRRLFLAHLLQHRNYKHTCMECGKGFFNSSGLWAHRKVHTGDKPYKCITCNRGFSQISALNSHVLTHTREKPFTCTVCSKNFTQPHHLKCHMLTHSGEKPYTCTYCDKSFAENRTLTVHTMRVHTGETPYICKVCNKGFHHPRNLKKHLQTHEVPQDDPSCSSQKMALVCNDVTSEA